MKRKTAEADAVAIRLKVTPTRTTLREILRAAVALVPTSPTS
jgi:hypothetical protein